MACCVANILVAGIYLAGRPNTASHLVYEFATSRAHRVTQRWVALALEGQDDCDLPFTVSICTRRTPKFLLVNERDRWRLLDTLTPAIDRFAQVAQNVEHARASDRFAIAFASARSLAPS